MTGLVAHRISTYTLVSGVHSFNSHLSSQSDMSILCTDFVCCLQIALKCSTNTTKLCPNTDPHGSCINGSFYPCELSKSTSLKCTIIYNIFPSYDVKSQHFRLTYGPQEKVTVSQYGVPNLKIRSNSILFYPITLEGRRGFTDEFATIPFHLDLFSAALVELAKSIPVHSLILSSHLFFCLPLFLFPFTVPCRIVFAKPEDLETWPNHLSFRFLTRVRS